MPFGIATAPEEYQRWQHEALEGLPGIYVIADDILITGQGETKEEALQDHTTSSPYHSQSNGIVEAAKTLQKKATKANQDQWLSCLDYRNTPTEGMDSSPVQRLISKRTNATLPIALRLLEPEIQSASNEN